MNPILLDVACIVCDKSLEKLKHNPCKVVKKMGKINTGRRSRTPNWSADEKQYLLELINQRKAVVVVVKNNGPNQYEEKNAAWKAIVREMEIRFGNKFTDISTKKVKTQWQNMKRIARDEINTYGVSLESLSMQSVEVCRILDMIENGVLKKSMIDSLRTSNVTPNVEVKTEREDDDFLQQPSCSGVPNIFAPNFNHDHEQLRRQSISPGALEIITDGVDDDDDDDYHLHDDENEVQTTDRASMTDPLIHDVPNNPFLDPFQKDLQETLKFSASVKQLKLESLKEERQVVRAMRETAELNKIIAEERLKHLLWAKKQATT